MPTSHDLHISYELYDTAAELPQDEATLLEQALKAAEQAHAPFSGYHVGCALLLKGGEIILGNNQENVAYPSGICAERTALFATGAAGKIPLVQKIAIRSYSVNTQVSSPPASCGACRQVMVEYERQAGHPFVVLTQGAEGGIMRLEGVKNCLMPFAFEGKF